MNKPTQDTCWDINQDIQTAILRNAKRIIVDFKALEEFDMHNETNLIKTLISNNGTDLRNVLMNFEKCLENFDRVKPSHIDSENEDVILRLGFKNLPRTYKLGELNDKKLLGKLIQTEGIINNIGIPFLVSLQKTFRCERCEYRLVESYSPFGKKIKERMHCPSCRTERPFIEIKEEEIVASFQLLTIVEESTSTTPISLTILLPEDLIDDPDPEKRKFMAGTKIKLVGVLSDRSIKGLNIKKPYLDTIYWETESDEIVLSEKDIEEIKKFSKEKDLIKKLTNAFCPSVYGNDEIKEALMLQVVGGITKKSTVDKKLKRGNIHILLIGDPSTAKTTLALFDFNYIPKAKYAVCSELTSAGLGVAMLKDKETESWYISSGVLVTANRSIAILDEIDKATPDDIKSLDVVMELQMLPVDKAGISMKLPAETTVLAVANPKFSRFDPYRDLKEQVEMSEVSLSRFDLKFAFRDRADEKVDRKIADKIFKREEMETEIIPEFLAKYLIYARKIDTKMTEESFNFLKDFYITLRTKASDKSGILQITPRQLEGLIRLTEAYAKLRLSNKTKKEDAENAIKIFKSYLRTFGFDPESGELDIDKAEGRTSGKVRKGIDLLQDILKDLHQKFGETIPKEELIKIMREDYDMKNPYELYNKALMEGIISEPKPDFCQGVNR